MKKFVGILLTVALIFAMLPGAMAETEDPAIISVDAPQIDSLVSEYGQRVRVNFENAEFTKTGVSVDIVYSTLEYVYDIEVIDDNTVEFSLKMFGAEAKNYSLQVGMVYESGFVRNMYLNNCIEVREGHFDFEINPITSDEINDHGITVKFYDPPEDIQGTFEFDRVQVDSTKIIDRVFRVYPDSVNYAGKSQVEVRFIYQNNYYRKTLYITDNEIYLEPESISRTEPLSFTINTMNLEFPEDTDDISVVARGKGRYIEFEDLTLSGSKELLVESDIPLTSGTYDLHVTWNGLGMTYIVPLVITRSSSQNDMDLDAATDAAIYNRYNGFDINVDDEIAQKYLASSKKTLDFSNRELERFYLVIEYSAMQMLADAGSGLDLLFGDCMVSIPAESIVFGVNADRDIYLLMEDDSEIEDLSVKYFSPVPGIHVDTNMSWFLLSRPEPSNLYSYDAVKLVHDYYETGQNVLPAMSADGMMQCEASETGTYQFVLEGMEFTDLNESYWGARYIYPLTTLGIINGMGDGTFAPEGLVTNAQFVKMVCEALGLDSSDGLTNFADVDMNGWYYNYVCAAEDQGIIDGTYFNPNHPMKRKDMAKVVVKAYLSYAGGNAADIADESTDAFLDIAMIDIATRNYIKAAYVLEIINGMTATSFSPDGNATRSQAAAMIYRLLEAMGIT
ncbi:MAG TPA: S-layer homology domain-containing protein [Clostridia bacterium]|nr:S-layer homology domain-containing protein [Clostridia bacterium]